MKKALSLLLALAMIISLAACNKPEPTPSSGAETQPTQGTDAPTTPGPTEPSSTEPAGPTGYVDDGKTYSYRTGPSDLPESWNLHTYQSNSSTYVLDNSSDTLFTFDYNDDFTGFVIVPSMAADYAVDVTSQYVGQYGIEAGDENKAWKITLKDNLKFDNGEKLDANSFVASMKLLLNPKAANFRADNVYQSGQLKIVGAEQYVKAGSSTFEDCTGGEGKCDYQGAVWSLESDGTDIPAEIADNIYFKGGSESFIGKYMVENAGRSLAAYLVRAGMFENEDIFNAMEDKTLTEILADEEMKAALQKIYEWWCTDPGEQYGVFCYKYTWPELEYDGTVGFFAPSDLELVVVLKNPMKDNFYLRYELCTNFFLVYAPLYESLITYDNGVYGNTYGTSVDTYVGYGPYKLTQYTEGAQIVLERNLEWHGYTPEDYVEGTYMTDRIVYNKVAENATRLEMFLKGELDSYGLQPEDMEDYLGSDYTVYTDSESTWYIAMNPGLENLTTVQAAASPITPGNEVNKTVLTIEEFRKALSYSVDREQQNLTLSPTSGVAKALLSSMIVGDPETGLTYRATTEGKDAILKFWGLSDAWGPGKEYEDRDEAIDSITGYDPAQAKQLFDTAYDKMVEQKLISEEAIASGKWEVQLILGRPTEGNYYTRGYEFYKTCWTNAVVGTKFEGHLEFIQSQVLGSTTFGSYLRNGQVDILFGVGYGGSMFDPYSMMDCFTGNLQYDPFTDKKAIDLDVELDGMVLRASLYSWVSECLQGDTITATVIGADGNPTSETVEISAGANDPGARRVTILAAAEAKVLTLANIFPSMTDASASLRCMRYNYKTDEYVVGMGFGGLQYNTWSMDDAEFAAYVKDQGGTLNYK